MKNSRFFSKKAFIVLGTLVAVLAIAIAGLVQAHPSLRAAESSPSPGQILSVAPTQVKLSFNVEDQGLVTDQSYAWVYKEEGLQVVALGKVDLSSAGRNVMIMALPANLSPGIYIVKWVAVSVVDRGFSEGSYSFAVTGK
ncbi:copper resistance protein CopC [Candidatus Acetothermia bacterium]|nr:copper resistance protein CopC [Candidatus Acetothermia bacterium]MBI3461274.1 copper resistance protein CopC [Candidatus Acetothermia bacterium]MBI3660576.1 copper resistance protein CopC [Candidatus Acetothermia bacterium]